MRKYFWNAIGLAFAKHFEVKLKLELPTKPVSRPWGHAAELFESGVQLAENSDNDNLFHINLENHINAQYIGTVYVGSQSKKADSPPVPMRAIYDTGSSWLWVQTNSCFQGDEDKCISAYSKYDMGTSYFLKPFTDSNQWIEVKYGIGYCEGQLVNDRVCLDPSGQSCDNSYPVLAVN